MVERTIRETIEDIWMNVGFKQKKDRMEECLERLEEPFRERFRDLYYKNLEKIREERRSSTPLPITNDSLMNRFISKAPQYIITGVIICGVGFGIYYLTSGAVSYASGMFSSKVKDPKEIELETKYGVRKKEINDIIEEYNDIVHESDSEELGKFDDNLVGKVRKALEDIHELSTNEVKIMSSVLKSGWVYDSAFLTVLMHKCKDQEMIIHTDEWRREPFALGYGLNNKNIKVYGDLGPYAFRNASDCNITATGDGDAMVGWHAQNCTFNAKNFGNFAGEFAEGCVFEGDKFGNNTGGFAKNCTFRAKTYLSYSSWSNEIGKNCNYYIKGELIKRTK